LVASDDWIYQPSESLLLQSSLSFYQSWAYKSIITYVVANFHNVATFCVTEKVAAAKAVLFLPWLRIQHWKTGTGKNKRVFGASVKSEA